MTETLLATAGQTSTPVRVSLVRLSATDPDDRTRYVEWDDLRRRIFAGELGWPLVERGSQLLGDPFDRHAACIAAIAAEKIVGGVRGLAVADGFPHRVRFDGYLKEAGLETRLDLVGTVNALAVEPGLRRQWLQGSSGAGYLSSLLLDDCLAWMQRRGIRVVLATVLSPRSMRVFQRAGFLRLNAPAVLSSSSSFRVADVGLVLPSAAPALESSTDTRLMREVEARFKARQAQAGAGDWA